MLRMSNLRSHNVIQEKHTFCFLKYVDKFEIQNLFRVVIAFEILAVLTVKGNHYLQNSVLGQRKYM